MHQTRAQVTKKIPIPRKGTKYIARAFIDPQNSVPIVIAIRDMLHLAKTSKEVQKMINEKLLKINGKEVKELRDTVRLFNILEADKSYELTFTPSGRFTFHESKSKERTCKVLKKTMLKGKITQLNLHDGSNVLTKEKISVNDTVYLDLSGKIKKHVQMEKGKTCFVFHGKYMGKKGKIDSIENGTLKVKLEGLEDSKELNKRGVLVL